MSIANINKPRIKVTKNIYGNFRGHISKQQYVELGCNSFDAKKWILDNVRQNPDIIISELSYFTADEISKFSEFMAR